MTPTLEDFAALLRDPNTSLAECIAVGRRALGLTDPRVATPTPKPVATRATTYRQD